MKAPSIFVSGAIGEVPTAYFLCYELIYSKFLVADGPSSVCVCVCVCVCQSFYSAH